MNARALLADLDAAGITVTRDGDNVRVRAEPGVSLTPYVERIKAHKPDLLRELLQIRIVAVLDVERERFDRPEYERLLAMWNAENAQEAARCRAYRGRCASSWHPFAEVSEPLRTIRCAPSGQDALRW